MTRTTLAIVLVLVLAYTGTLAYAYAARTYASVEQAIAYTR